MGPNDTYGVHVYNINAGRWETIKPLEPLAVIQEEERVKTLDEKIDEYLDMKGITNPEIRSGLKQIIHEHEEE